jgi:hypothetical protein
VQKLAGRCIARSGAGVNGQHVSGWHDLFIGQNGGNETAHASPRSGFDGRD